MIKLPSYFSGFSSLVDGSASLRFTTQEIQAEEFVELKKNQNAFGWLVFQAGENANIALPKEPVRDRDDKSPSKRLKDRMFVYFTKKNLAGDFEAWYKSQLDTIGQKYLDKLN